MYTAVLMMALSGTSSDIDFGRRCNGGASACNGATVACSGRHVQRCSGGGLFQRCGGGRLFGRNRSNCCAPVVTCSGTTTTTTNGSGTSTQKEAGVKISKEVQDAIDGDAAVKEYYNGLKTNKEKQEYADSIQKDIDDEAAKAKNKKKPGKVEEQTQVVPTPAQFPAFGQSQCEFVLDSRLAIRNTIRFIA